MKSLNNPFHKKWTNKSRDFLAKEERRNALDVRARRLNPTISKSDK